MAQGDSIKGEARLSMRPVDLRGHGSELHGGVAMGGFGACDGLPVVKGGRGSTSEDVNRLENPDTTLVLLLGHDYPDEQQHCAWRGMTSVQKYEVFASHMDLMRDLKRAGVKALHSEWDEARIEAEVARIYLHGQT